MQVTIPWLDDIKYLLIKDNQIIGIFDYFELKEMTLTEYDRVFSIRGTEYWSIGEAIK